MKRRTYRLLLAYDGTKYYGWQRLPGKQTVQGRIEQSLSEIFGEAVEISGSGRTDAGVHAKGQVASFTAPEIPRYTLLARLRHLLPGDIGVISVDYAADRFHARLCATEKTYVYRIWNSDTPDIFDRHYRLQFPRPLDIEKMRQGAARLLGQHDFLGFCANKHFKKSSVRTLRRLEISIEGAELRFSLTADGFLYHMARIIVGTLLEIGTGKRAAESILTVFQEKKRELAGETVPAKGLCLMEVRYDG